MGTGEPEITAFFDEATSSLSYLVADPATGHALVVDPLYDYAASSARLSAASVEKIAAAAAGKRIDWIVETHPHADHVSGAVALRTLAGGRIAIGAGVVEVQKSWGDRLELEPEFRRDGSQFDRLLRDGDVLECGDLRARVIDTPGHTPACTTLAVSGPSGRLHAFVGDLLFMPDGGTARTDFPGGSARTLYRSIRRILDLPGDTLLYTAHDYRPGGRALAWASSVAEQRAANIHVKDGVDEAAFVAMREARDRTLDTPNLLLPAIQINIRGGALPPASTRGARFLKIPLSVT
jgi:glyoxylase-like metal-dependent hydrolase (beta-lactamase superfamily II)